MGDNDKSQWFRNLVVIPLIVGLILGFATFLIPRFFEDKKEVSCTIERPTSYLDDPAFGSVTIEVNGEKIERLVAYRVRVWNSGDLPLKNLPVRFVFGPKENLSDFQIFSIVHDTIPPYEFGEIKDNRSEAVAPRVVYGLLNPGDQDIVTLLANKKADLDVFSKLEGVSVNQVVSPEEETVWSKFLPFLTALIGIIGAIFGTVLSYYFGKSNLQVALRKTEE